MPRVNGQRLRRDGSAPHPHRMIPESQEPSPSGWVDRWSSSARQCGSFTKANGDSTRPHLRRDSTPNQCEKAAPNARRERTPEPARSRGRRNGRRNLDHVRARGGREHRNPDDTAAAAGISTRRDDCPNWARRDPESHSPSNHNRRGDTNSHKPSDFRADTRASANCVGDAHSDAGTNGIGHPNHNTDPGAGRAPCPCLVHDLRSHLASGHRRAARRWDYRLDPDAQAPGFSTDRPID